MKKVFIYFFLLIVLLLTHEIVSASEAFSVPVTWPKLSPILMARVNQHQHKMKIERDEAISFVHFLDELNTPLPQLKKLQPGLPKTTLELLIKLYEEKIDANEAEKMAAYLISIVKQFHFENVRPFDANTSHIIGKEWHEIDYSGEGMTWQKQRLKYLPYGVTNFKTEENLKKFFAVESKLPYFKKIYRPCR